MLKYNTVSCYGSWKYLDVAMIRLEYTTKCDVLWIHELIRVVQLGTKGIMQVTNLAQIKVPIF